MLMYVLRVYASVCAMMCTSKSCPVIKSGKLTAHDSNHHRVIWALILFKPISFTSCNCKLKTAFILNAQWSDKLHSSRCFNDNLLEVQLNLYQIELLFRYVFPDLTWNCLLTSEDLPKFTMICRKMLTKLFLFWHLLCRTILRATICKNW